MADKVKDQVVLVMRYEGKSDNGMSVYSIRDVSGKKRRYPKKKKACALWSQHVHNGGEMEVITPKRVKKRILVLVPPNIHKRYREPFLKALQAKTKTVK